MAYSSYMDNILLEYLRTVNPTYFRRNTREYQFLVALITIKTKKDIIESIKIFKLLFTDDSNSYKFMEKYSKKFEIDFSSIEPAKNLIESTYLKERYTSYNEYDMYINFVKVLDEIPEEDYTKLLFLRRATYALFSKEKVEYDKIYEIYIWYTKFEEYKSHRYLTDILDVLKGRRKPRIRNNRLDIIKY